MFLIFPTKELAQQACDRIFSNIRNWLKEYYPIRVHPLGLIALSIDGTPSLKAEITTKWADPQQYKEGWGIPKPEQKDLGLIPVIIALQGIEGLELPTVTPIETESSS